MQRLIIGVPFLTGEIENEVCKARVSNPSLDDLRKAVILRPCSTEIFGTFEGVGIKLHIKTRIARSNRVTEVRACFANGDKSKSQIDTGSCNLINIRSLYKLVNCLLCIVKNRAYDRKRIEFYAGYS